MTFVLSRQLFQSLISDRSKSVIEYELKKFDKLNKRKMNQFKKFSIQQEKTKIEKMIQLGHELKESAQKKQLIKEKNLIMILLENGVIQVFLIFKLNLPKVTDLERIQMETLIEPKNQGFFRLLHYN